MFQTNNQIGTDSFKKHGVALKTIVLLDVLSINDKCFINNKHYMLSKHHIVIYFRGGVWTRHQKRDSPSEKTLHHHIMASRKDAMPIFTGSLEFPCNKNFRPIDHMDTD